MLAKICLVELRGPFAELDDRTVAVAEFRLRTVFLVFPDLEVFGKHIRHGFRVGGQLRRRRCIRIPGIAKDIETDMRALGLNRCCRIADDNLQIAFDMNEGKPKADDPAFMPHRFAPALRSVRI